MLSLRLMMYRFAIAPRWTLAVLLLSAASAGYTQDLSSVASRVADRLRDAPQKKMFPRIVVNSFSTRSGDVSMFTEALSDEFSEQLSKNLAPNSVIDRRKFAERTKLSLFTPLDLQRRDVATWLAERVDANTLIIGTIDAATGPWTLRLQAVWIADGKVVFDVTSPLEAKPEWLDLRDKPLPSSEKPRLAVGCDQSASDKPNLAFDAAGVTPPKCGYCPDPSYTDEARRRKFQGRIVVDCMVDESGRVTPLRVKETGSLDLVDHVLETYRSWKLEPAKKEGKPVAVCVPIESSFKLF